MKIIVLTLVFFLASFINPTYVFSADACSPWVCVGTQGYGRVYTCRGVVSCGSAWCTNGVYGQDSFSCPDASTCTGNAPGVNGCLSPATISSTGCNCSAAGYSCSSSSFNGASCGTADYPGYCQDCISTAVCTNSNPQDGERGCCVPPEGEPTPTPTPTPADTFYCNDSCTTDAQCSNANSLWTCDDTENRCRLISEPANVDCIPTGGLGCNDSCTTDSQCSNTNDLWTCDDTELKCRLTSNSTSITCEPVVGLACNAPCTSDEQCSITNDLWTCDDTELKCRDKDNPTSISCVPCYPSCGGTVCGDTGATPNQVTGILVNTISSGNINLTSSSILNITWNDPGVPDPNSTIDYYEIKIWDKVLGTTPPAAASCTGTEASKCNRYVTASKIESYSVAASSAHDNDLYVAVRAINDSCVGLGTGAWSANSPYNLVADVGGNFYNDPLASQDAITFNCTGSTATPVDLSTETGTTVTTSKGGTSGAINTSYLISNVPYAPISGWDDYEFNVSLAINNSDPLNPLICTCPVDLTDPYLCVHTDTPSPALSENFYLSTIDLSNDSWWQTSGGNVYGANSLTSPISNACAHDLDCNAFIITQNADADAKSAGIPMTGAASMDSNGFFTQRESSGQRAIGTKHNNLIKEDYAYFSRGVDLSTAADILTILSAEPTPDTEIYYSDGDYIADLSGYTLNVTSNRKIVVFVNGDITFSSDPDTNLITVEPGGFFGVIASGNITFDSSVGNTDPTDTTPNIAGVFVADGLIKVDGYSDDALKDNKFVGEGTFVGWSGFSLTRHYDNTTYPLDRALNNTNPIEVFNFRPDFNLNIPDIMMRPSLVWQEVN